MNRMKPGFHPLIDPVTLSLPTLPESLDGLIIAQLTDLHITRWRRRFRRVLAALETIKPDLVVHTGDYMSLPGDETISLTVMREICDRLDPPLGSYGVFGNHDSREVRDRLGPLPIHWLNDDSYVVKDFPIQIMGFFSDLHTRPDVVTTLGTLPNNGAISKGGDDDPVPLRILLSHYPTTLPIAADIGTDLMFSGHTHGGQIRLPNRRALLNSTDLPLHLSSGILRHQDTICVLSRGLGDNWIPLRMFCPPQLPLCTLRRGARPGRRTPHIENVVPW